MIVAVLVASLVNLSGCPTTSKPRLVTVKTFVRAETTFNGELIDEILNWLPTVTDSPVPRVALAKVHSVAAVQAASAPTLNVPAAKGAHANAFTPASCATVPANQPLHPPMDSVETNVNDCDATVCDTLIVPVHVVVHGLTESAVTVDTTTPVPLPDISVIPLTSAGEPTVMVRTVNAIEPVTVRPPTVNDSGVPVVSVPKTELVVPAETIWVPAVLMAVIE